VAAPSAACRARSPSRWTFLDALQVQSALEHRVGYLSGMARELRDLRAALDDPKPGEGEDALATAIASVQRATRALDAASATAARPTRWRRREGETESELRAAWGDR
jgi:hypothetical protein